ncbi:hypothetical protein NYV37_11205 [Escherichia coli]|nr:hypothetical protein [Escherichia coli]
MVRYGGTQSTGYYRLRSGALQREVTLTSDGQAFKTIWRYRCAATAAVERTFWLIKRQSRADATCV